MSDSKNLEQLLEDCQSSTFREYLLWKNQNLNVGLLINKLAKSKNVAHFLAILKSALYDSKRFQFLDFSYRFIDLIYSDKKLYDSPEILIFVPDLKMKEFDR